MFHTHNIHPEGLVDVYGEHFCRIAQMCAYMIMPSCSEGMAGSVLTAMSAGMIPIVSRECGFDDDDVIHLPNCELDTICSYVKEYAEKEPSWIQERSTYAYIIASTKYSRAAFSASIYAAMNVLHKGKNAGKRETGQ